MTEADAKRFAAELIATALRDAYAAGERAGRAAQAAASPPASEQRELMALPGERGAVDGKLRAWLEGSEHFKPLAKDRHATFWRTLESAYDGYSWLFFEDEIKRADAWLAANPQRRPTERGLARFMRNWLEKAVEIGRRREAMRAQGARR